MKVTQPPQDTLNSEKRHLKFKRFVFLENAFQY